MFEVKPALREATPALIGLWGPSGCGKTYSALLLARGLSPKGKIVVIDTENGRAKFYANLVGGWHHIDFQPPFTAERYTEAMLTAEKAGADVILVDSMSHVWEGEGGTLEQADNSEAKGLLKWKAPKMAFKRMMNNLLRSPVHVIFCVRAKEKYAQLPDKSIISQGLTPIMEKNFIFEMTVAVQLSSADHCAIAPVKVPEDLAQAIPAGKLLSIETGAKIAEWVAGGAAVDREGEALKREARNKASEGSVAMRTWWEALTKAKRQGLSAIVEELRVTAAQADQDLAKEAEGEPVHDPLADAFTPDRLPGGKAAGDATGPASGSPAAAPAIREPAPASPPPATGAAGGQQNSAGAPAVSQTAPQAQAAPEASPGPQPLPMPTGKTGKPSPADYLQAVQTALMDVTSPGQVDAIMALEGLVGTGKYAPGSNLSKVSAVNSGTPKALEMAATRRKNTLAGNPG